MAMRRRQWERLLTARGAGRGPLFQLQLPVRERSVTYRWPQGTRPALGVMHERHDRTARGGAGVRCCSGTPAACRPPPSGEELRGAVAQPQAPARRLG